MISTLTLKELEGKCMYCNHCQPSQAGLNIGLITSIMAMSWRAML